MVEAARDQLYRVLSNLARNAKRLGAAASLCRAAREQGSVGVEVSDDRPRLPAKGARKSVPAFFGSARPGGSGLGLRRSPAD